MDFSNMMAPGVIIPEVSEHVSAADLKHNVEVDVEAPAIDSEALTAVPASFAKLVATVAASASEEAVEVLPEIKESAPVVAAPVAVPETSESILAQFDEVMQEVKPQFEQKTSLRQDPALKEAYALKAKAEQQIASICKKHNPHARYLTKSEWKGTLSRALTDAWNGESGRNKEYVEFVALADRGTVLTRAGQKRHMKAALDALADHEAVEYRREQGGQLAVNALLKDTLSATLSTIARDVGADHQMKAAKERISALELELASAVGRIAALEEAVAAMSVAGVPPRAPTPLSQPAQAKELQAQGKSNAEIARILNVNRSTVGRWLK